MAFPLFYKNKLLLWADEKLSPLGIQIRSLSDFRDGVALIRLAETLTHLHCTEEVLTPSRQSCLTTVESLSNAGALSRFLTDLCGVNLLCFRPSDIVTLNQDSLWMTLHTLYVVSSTGSKRRAAYARSPFSDPHSPTSSSSSSSSSSLSSSSSSLSPPLSPTRLPPAASSTPLKDSGSKRRPPPKRTADPSLLPQALLIQRFARFSVARKTAERNKKLLIQRGRLIKETLESETEYIHRLAMAIRQYKEPLLQSGVIENEVIDIIFQNVHEIYTLHCRLHKKLKQRIDQFGFRTPEEIAADEAGPRISIFAANPTRVEVQQALFGLRNQPLESLPVRATISDIFTKLIPSMDCYKKYCVGYSMMVEILKKAIERNRGLFQDLQYACSDKADLSSLLITPVQRLPRYILLLGDIWKLTPDEHPDKEGLELARTMIQKLTTDLDEGIAAAKRMKQLFSIRYRLYYDFEDHEDALCVTNPSRNRRPNPLKDVDITIPGRFHIIDGAVSVYDFERQGTFVMPMIATKSVKKEVQHYRMYLMSDIIILAEVSKVAKSTLVFRKMINLLKPQTLVKSINLPEDLTPTSETTEIATKGFYLISSKKTYLMSAASTIDRDLWIAHIQQAILALEESGQRDQASPEFGHGKMSVSVVAVDQSQKDHAEYVMSVETDLETYMVQRRYREFLDFRNKLKTRFPDSNWGTLPSKRMTGSTAPDVVEARRLMLDRWLQEILNKRDSIHHGDLVDEFLSNPSRVTPANQ